MPVFAVLIENHPAVNTWLSNVGKKLSSTDYFRMPFTGGLRSHKVLGPETRLWVVEVTPVYPRLVLNVASVFLFVIGMMAVILWQSSIGLIIGLAGVGIAGIINLFWEERFYINLVRLQLRRLTGRWVRVTPANAVALRRLL